METGGDRASRLQELEDVQAIRRLFLDYGRCLDGKDWVRYAELFADDGELSAPIGVTKGRRALRDLFEVRLKDVPSAFHVFRDAIVDVDGDRARASSMYLYIRPGPDGWPELLQFGRYTDDLVRRDGQWLFRRRSITRDGGSAPYST